MKQKFLSGLAYILFLNLLIKPIWIFGIERTAQNLVGTQYGLYFALFNLSLIFNMLLDFGLNNYTSRNVAQNPKLTTNNLGEGLGLKVILSIFYLLVLLLTATFLGYKHQAFNLILVLGINQILLSVILFIRANLTGLLAFKQDSFLSVFDRVLMIVICGVIFFVPTLQNKFTIFWFAIIQTVSYFLTLIFGLYFIHKQHIKLQIVVSIAKAKSILKKSAPFASLVLLMAIYTRIDGLMIEQLLLDGTQQAAAYAKGFRVLDAANMVAYLFAALLLPVFSSLIVQNKPVNQITELSCKLLIIPAVVGVGCCIWFSTEIINALYWEVNGVDIAIFVWLMPNLIAFSLTYIFGTLLTAANQLKSLNIMAFGGVVVNISLNFWLIPKYGALGAAYATIFTQFVTAISQIIIATKIFNLAFVLNFFLKLGVIILVLILLAKFIIIPAISVIYGFLALFILLIILVFAFGLIKITDFKNLWSVIALANNQKEI